MNGLSVRRESASAVPKLGSWLQEIVPRVVSFSCNFAGCDSLCWSVFQHRSNLTQSYQLLAVWLMQFAFVS